MIYKIISLIFSEMCMFSQHFCKVLVNIALFFLLQDASELSQDVIFRRILFHGILCRNFARIEIPENYLRSLYSAGIAKFGRNHKN